MPLQLQHMNVIQSVVSAPHIKFYSVLLSSPRGPSPERLCIIYCIVDELASPTVQSSQMNHAKKKKTHTHTINSISEYVEVISFHYFHL